MRNTARTSPRAAFHHDEGLDAPALQTVAARQTEQAPPGKGTMSDPVMLLCLNLLKPFWLHPVPAYQTLSPCLDRQLAPTACTEQIQVHPMEAASSAKAPVVCML